MKDSVIVENENQFNKVVEKLYTQKPDDIPHFPCVVFDVNGYPEHCEYKKGMNALYFQQFNEKYQFVKNPLNEQIGGDHYKNMKIQPAEYITKNQIGFLEGLAIKYVSRYDHKGGKQDLEKAIHSIQLLIQLKYES